ncbi:MAG: glycosyltransferase family 2 protein [Cyclobacteriaceae bacterium]|nr:glycosyltransferase family 2 protein [Cyclobacteriaceae bacterium HetDA_MAG_MS6]
MEWLIISGYGLSLLVITIFSLGQVNLAWHYMKANRKGEVDRPALKIFPHVTVQLPIYNEKYVVERLLEAIASFDYPKDKLEIQILDDSTDETVDIISKKVQELKRDGLDIQHIQRDIRVGFKAGALQYGLECSKGEFLAIFDADFLPEKDFLLATLPHFVSEHTGMVQTKWGHINQDYSVLTKMQAFGLNAHFTIEQKGRLAAGSFINFNGTGGVWRKSCIQDAGGWHHDTLTEDLDLSYRAQLKGWKFEYLEEVTSPAELPVVIPAIKSQQYRWNKGAAETARKNLGKIIRSGLNVPHKIRAALHLLNSSVFLFLLVSAILSIPMLYIKENNPALSLLFDLGSIFLVGFLAMSIFYWMSAKASNPHFTLRYYAGHFIMFLAFSMGLALHNSIAIIEGYLGIKTPFIRTPKFNITKKSDSWKGNQYLKSSVSLSTILEGLLTAYFIFGIFSGFKLEDYGLILFHGMLALGFGFIFLVSIKPIKHA